MWKQSLLKTSGLFAQVVVTAILAVMIVHLTATANGSGPCEKDPAL